MAGRLNAFIDPPSPFAPLNEWEAYLATLKTYPREEVADLIQEAEAEIAERRKAPER
ncbi:MAG: hypothetical protein A49_08600 [Methyloceanibacter sp.]|nr:MAG: hypothetical protein A49_08600 [Methyloceanibacter sp.]